MENESSRQSQKQTLHKIDVSGSLPCGCLKCYPNVFPNLRFNVCPDYCYYGLEYVDITHWHRTI